MTTARYVLTFAASKEITPEDRRRLKDHLGDCVRFLLDIDAPVAIDQRETKR